MLTRSIDAVVMADVADDPDNSTALSVSAVLCIAPNAFERYGRVLRHLAVGLVDQAIRLRLISADPRVSALSLGPIQSLLHPALAWPAGRSRTRKLLDDLHAEPPTTVHALSGPSYSLARELAEEFDADLFVQVASMDDCEEVAKLSKDRVAGFLTTNMPFAEVLERQLGIAAEQIHLVRPGILAAQQPACFPDDRRTPTLLCTSPLERKSGVDLLIEAVAILQQREFGLLVFLLGRGSRESALRRVIRQRKLSSVVTFAQPLGDLSQAMSGADLFLRPSADTAFTVDTLQAMGAGVVVVTFPSAVCDHLRDGETAVLCEKRTPQALADAVETLLSDRDAARRIAASAMAYVRQHHAMSGMAERTAGLYRKFALARATFPIRGS